MTGLYEQIKADLGYLQLKRAGEVFATVADEAKAHEWTHIEFLARLLDEEAAQGVVSTKPNVFEQSPDLVDRGLDLCLRSRQERSEVALDTAEIQALQHQVRIGVPERRPETRSARRLGTLWRWSSMPPSCPHSRPR